MPKRRGHKHKPKPKSNKLAPLPDHKKQRRDIKQGKVVEELSSENHTVEPTDIVRLRGRGDSGLLLTDPHRLKSDVKLIEAAVRKGWNVRRKTMIRRRLENIVAKTSAEVVTKEGIVSLDSAGDKLAIDAAKVLVAMDNQDINRVDKVYKNSPPQTAVTVNVNNTTNNTAVTFDQRTVELARLGRQLGTRDIVVGGKRILVADILGSVGGLPEDVSAAESSIGEASNKT